MEVKKYRSIKVRVLPVTNYRPWRVKLIDEYFNQSLTFSRSDSTHLVIEDGINRLKQLGFNIIGYSEDKDDYSVFCDNWGQNCVKLKGA